MPVPRRRGPSADGRLLAYVPAARRRLWLAVVCGFLAATTTIASGLLLSVVIAAVFVESRPPDAILPLMAALVLLGGARATFLFMSELLAQRAASRLKGHLRRDVTGRLFELGPAHVSAERSGDLASTLVNGLEGLDAWMTSYLPARSLAVVVPLLVLAVVLVIDPPTALVLVFTGPVLILLLALIGSRTRAISERRFAELRWMSAYFVDMLRGIATLKAFGRSTEQVGNMRQISRQFGETTLEVLRSAFQTGLVLDWAGAVAMALVAVEVSLRLMVGRSPSSAPWRCSSSPPSSSCRCASWPSATTREAPARSPPNDCSRSSTHRRRSCRSRREPPETGRFPVHLPSPSMA